VNEDDYAIVVGIDTYPLLRALHSSKADASLVAEWLQSPTGGGVPGDHVALIVSGPNYPAHPFDATPVQTNIDRALFDWGAAGRKRIGRRLYFYFAGHGIGLNFTEVGMLMANASMEMLNSNIGLMPYLIYFHDTVLFDEVVFILDCCRDPVSRETTRGPSFGGSRGTGAALAPGATAVPAAPAGQVEAFVVLAAEYGAEAFAPTDDETGERRGVLTQAVLEALKGTAAADAAGRITAFSLQRYVIDRVPEIATDARLKQEPRIDIVPKRDLVFRTLTAAEIPRSRVRIIAPPGFTGQLIVRDGSGTIEIDRRNAADVTDAGPPWELDLLLNSKYEVEHTDSDPAEVLNPRKVKNNVFRFRTPA
jgi:hypothetical protein